MATNPKVLDPAPTSDEDDDFDAVLDRVLSGAKGRIQEQIKRAQALGIIDAEGNLLSDDLLDDMKPGAQRDFGG